MGEQHLDAFPVMARLLEGFCVSECTGGLGRDMTGADLVVPMFAEMESPAVWLLGEHEMTRQDAMNFRLHDIGRTITNG